MGVRALAGLATVLAASTFTAAHLALQSKPQGIAMFAYNEQRFARVRGAVPDHGTIGYLSDWSTDAANTLGSQALFVARYVLAPVQVADDSGEPIVLGNFYDLQAAEALVRERGL